MKKRIVNLVQLSVGNIGSIIRILNDLNYEHRIILSPEQFDLESKIILPGVGSFDVFMQSLKKQNLYNKIKELVYNNSKILGICVGMQSLFKGSEEGKEVGFGFFNTNFVKFKKNPSIKIPHIGWNKVIFKKKNILLEEIEDNYFYFTHSYHINNEIDVKHVLADTNYSYNFPSIVSKNNIYGVQFHPEKSYRQGLQIIKNFLEKC